MEAKKQRIKELIGILNNASYEYYQKANEIMSNFEYDRLYDELVALEKETGVIYSDSPTVNVGYEVVSELPKEQHASAMLSLDKTKEVDALIDFSKGQKCDLSWKLDGLTVVLTYRQGQLEKAVTRGNGSVGEVITANAKTFKNLPLKIPFEKELVIRGEAVIKYSDFEAINAEIEDVESKYKNPRNLCSGSVRQLNSEITAKRNVNFYAFALISAENEDFDNSVSNQFKWLNSQGFETVEYLEVDENSIRKGVEYFSEKIKNYDIPSDGLVMVYDDIAYGLSLGTTAKFPRNGIAFKWADELQETTLLEIEWSPSRTGLINPVAIFDPVELEGTTVSRASLHNLSIMEGLELGIGDRISVFKANMIIPQIADNFTRSGNVKIPSVCPVCGTQTVINDLNGVKTLLCPNPKCAAKHIKQFVHFVSRDAMNIEGLSEETIIKFIEKGYIHKLSDIYRLADHRESIVEDKGFGVKSYEKIMDAIEKSRMVKLPNLIYSLGIPNIGLSNAKILCKCFDNDLDKIKSATREELVKIDKIGDVIADSIVSYFDDKVKDEELNNILAEVELFAEENGNEQNMEGLSFVITGSVSHFANRNELKKYIEDRGGKVIGSVSAKTNYLINNDITSSSSKNKKAKELGIEILTEDVFLEMFG